MLRHPPIAAMVATIRIIFIVRLFRQIISGEFIRSRERERERKREREREREKES